MAKVEEPTVEVKLFVDKEKRKVLFAESDKEFVDVLFSFLTMPLGTIVRILIKQSQMGCLDELYKNVEDLSVDYFQTKACKAMLLKPLNAAASHCRRLKINIDDTKPRAVYICRNTSCCARDDCEFSSFPDAACKCGKTMQYGRDMPENEGDSLAPDGGGLESGVFGKGLLKFVITDDLIVAPASTPLMLSLFERFGVDDPENIEETILQFNSQKIISLLKRSLTSKQPLTRIYFDATLVSVDADLDVLPEQQNDADEKVNIAKMKVLRTKTDSLLYVEGDAEFIDLLFGLLSIPLGSIIKAFGQWPPSGCVDNLWKSIDGSAKGCVRPECQSLLLAPKSAPFGCAAAKVLGVDELAPTVLDINCCFRCLKNYGFDNTVQCRYNCMAIVKSAKLYELNPRRAPKDRSGNSESYVKGGHMRFMVTGDLHVHPLSISATLQVLRDGNVQTEELEEREIGLTKFQVMEIQRAALMGRAALSSVFLPPNKKKRKAESRVASRAES
ncbi:hypothetical protein U9M48_033650 [Paspalum notatum var. saurae]|uniref:DUF674 family protein n=1 Tax=Paspalum notatum var. saurae TaxID=547442 RepID=A0AAQ3U7F9_PASNO